MLTGVCQSCGRVDVLHSCPVCGALVCSRCLIPGDGCKLCHGRKMFQ